VLRAAYDGLDGIDPDVVGCTNHPGLTRVISEG